MSVRKSLLIGAIALVMVGGGIVMLVVVSQEVIWRQIPTGATGTLRETAILFVDPTGLSAWNRAYDNRDQAGMDRATRLYETLSIPSGTRVKVTDRRRGMIQVEMLEGGHAGRRGWIEPEVFVR